MFDRDRKNAPEAREAQGRTQPPGRARPVAAATRVDAGLDGALRVLVVHNHYRQAGGEDAVFADEVSLLTRQGHAVATYTRHNDTVDETRALGTARDAVWCASSAAEFDALLGSFRPDVVHAHNLFPAISPSVAWVARRRRVPFVLTLHNYRLLCPQAMFLRAGRVCEDCLGRLPLPAIGHRCYRDSRAASAAVAAMLVAHRAIGTWSRCVDRFIALTRFARDRFVAGGLPGSRIVVEPNFVDDPGPFSSAARSPALLFVGRLSSEKGVGILSTAARLAPGVEIRVAGEGPAAGCLDGVRNVVRLGRLPAADVVAEMRRARALVLPSLWYEGLPRVLVEAFACGLPVIASDIGALAEHVEPGRTGWLVPPADAAALAAAMREAAARAEACALMGAAVRAEYEARFTAAKHGERLRSIYAEAASARCPAPQAG